MRKGWEIRGVSLIRYLLSALICCLAAADAQPPDEYSVKAAFVYNFLKYIEWPDTAGCKASGRIKLGILGKNPFGSSFDRFKQKPIDNCILEVHEVKANEPINLFQAVFICRSEKKKLNEILTDLKSLPVVTLADSPGSMQEGVIINLIQREDKLGFEINKKIADSAGLKISSQLLKLASAIHE